jgi:hypothetical protein
MTSVPVASPRRGAFVIVALDLIRGPPSEAEAARRPWLAAREMNFAPMARDSEILASGEAEPVKT